MDNILEHLDGSREVIADKSHQPMASNIEDVITALEFTANSMEEQMRGTAKRKVKAPEQFVVPEGYKLVPIEAEGVAGEEELTANTYNTYNTSPSFNDIGIAVPKESKLSDKEALDELLA